MNDYNIRFLILPKPVMHISELAIDCSFMYFKADYKGLIFKVYRKYYIRANISVLSSMCVTQFKFNNLCGFQYNHVFMLNVD